MASDKASSVSSKIYKKKAIPDNQQERIETCGWIVGFVDGEGSFLVSIFRSPRAKMGWQVFPEFNVSQTRKDINLLQELKKFFGCGHIYIHQTRMKKEKEWDVLYKYCVRARKELKEKIIPFFEKHPPKGVSKRNDFKRFVKIIKLMEKGKHLTIEGMKEIIEITKNMTHRKPFHLSSASKFLSSPETIRRAPPPVGRHADKPLI